MVAEFASAINENRAPLTDGHAGLRVLAVLEAASESQRRAGAMAAVGMPVAGRVGASTVSVGWGGGW
jgi:hypothetical protein